MRRFSCVLSVTVCWCFVTGCGGPPATTSKDSPNSGASAKDEGHHHGTGPHGGTVADWGGGAYHVEFTVDHATKETAVYVMAGDGKTADPITASNLTLSINEPAFELELDPQPLPGEAAGTSSRFVGRHDNLGKVQEFAGTISGEVDGTPYAGEFQEVAEGQEREF